MQLLEITTFGGLVVSTGDQTMSRFRSRSAALVLAYLAMHPDRRVSREELTEVVWPESDAGKGRHNLRTVLLSLRSQFEEPYRTIIQSDPQSLQLNTSTYTVDALRFQELVEVDSFASESDAIVGLSEAMRLYRGPFLLGLYSDWVIEQQLRFEEMFVEAALKLAGLEESRGGLHRALVAARRAQQTDPMREDLARLVCRLQLAKGDIEGASTSFQRYRSQVVAETGIEPSFTFDQIKGGAEPIRYVPVSPKTLPTPQGTAALLAANTASLVIDDPARLPMFDFLSEEISELVFTRATSAALAAIHSGSPASFALDVCELNQADQRPRRLLESLLSAALPGQLLCTDRATAFLSDNPEIRVVDLGSYILKGSGKPQRIYQFQSARSPSQTFEPLNARRSNAGRIPIPVTKCFGRTETLLELEDLLKAGSRLITLLGPGGNGKTRLAIEVLNRVVDLFPGGVYFISLAGVKNATELDLAIGKGVGLPPSKGPDYLREMLAGLDFGQALIALDNAEHIAKEVAEALAPLLEGELSIQFLVTSRVRLGIPTELVFPVTPLETSLVGEETGASLSSTQMFVDRCRAITPDFQLTPKNRRAISEVCTKLEGIPLAIELAAARVRTFPPEAMLQELSHRLDFLATKASFVPDRHKTMRSAIDWSYQLLSPALQQFFRTLTVFSGTWSGEAALSVCGAEAEDIEALIDASLIEYESHDQGGRLRMLETIREFGMEVLSDDERHDVEGRMVSFFVRLVEEASASFSGSEQAHALERIDLDLSNILRAIEIAMEVEPELALAIAMRLPRYWEVRSYFRQGLLTLTSVETAVRRAGSQCPEATSAAGAFAAMLGDYDRAKVNFETALGQFTEDNPQGLADCFNGLGNIAYLQGDFVSALRNYGEAVRLTETLGERRKVAILLHNMANVHTELGNREEAKPLHERGIKIAIELDDSRMTALFRVALALVALNSGDLSYAEALARHALVTFEAIGDRHNIAKAHHILGSVALALGKLNEALADFELALRMNRETGARIPEACCLHRMALIFLAQDDTQRAHGAILESCRLFLQLAFSTERPEAFLVLSLVQERLQELRGAARSYGYASASSNRASTVLDSLDIIQPEDLEARLRSSMGGQAFEQESSRGGRMDEGSPVDILAELLESS